MSSTITAFTAKQQLASATAELARAEADYERINRHLMAGVGGFTVRERTDAKEILDFATERVAMLTEIANKADTGIEDTDDMLSEIVQSALKSNPYRLGIEGANIIGVKRPGRHLPESQHEVRVAQQENTVHSIGGIASGRVWVVVYGPADDLRVLDPRVLTEVLAEADMDVSVGNSIAVEDLENGYARKMYEIRVKRAALTVPVIAVTTENDIRTFARSFTRQADGLRYNAAGGAVNVNINTGVIIEGTGTTKKVGDHRERTVRFTVEVGADRVQGFLGGNLIEKLTPVYEGLDKGLFANGLGRVLSSKIIETHPISKAWVDPHRAVNGVSFTIESTFAYRPAEQ